MTAIILDSDDGVSAIIQPLSIWIMNFCNYVSAPHQASMLWMSDVAVARWCHWQCHTICGREGKGSFKRNLLRLASGLTATVFTTQYTAYQYSTQRIYSPALLAYQAVSSTTIQSTFGYWLFPPRKIYIATAFGCVEGEMTGTKPNDVSTTGSMAMPLWCGYISVIIVRPLILEHASLVWRQTHARILPL